MSVEAYWYQSFSGGEPPKMRRLCRQPLDRQWAAAIELAIAYSEGRAGYRPIGRHALTGETTWWWPQTDGDWWLIPPRVEKRCFALNHAAIDCEIRRGRGQATGQAITGRLRAWERSGLWRKIAAPIHPRHGKTATHPFGRPARRKKAVRRAVEG